MSKDKFVHFEGAADFKKRFETLGEIQNLAMKLRFNERPLEAAKVDAIYEALGKKMADPGLGDQIADAIQSLAKASEAGKLDEALNLALELEKKSMGAHSGRIASEQAKKSARLLTGESDGSGPDRSIGA